MKKIPLSLIFAARNLRKLNLNVSASKLATNSKSFKIYL